MEAKEEKGALGWLLQATSNGEGAGSRAIVHFLFLLSASSSDAICRSGGWILPIHLGRELIGCRGSRTVLAELSEQAVQFTPIQNDNISHCIGFWRRGTRGRRTRLELCPHFFGA
jgi:hypothetical protein